MPLYEYECEVCGHRFEAIQKFSDAPLTTCPKCGGAVRKLIASPAFQFKGTGWYITDYAKKDNAKKDGASGKSSSGSGESSADKSEAKAEKKADSPKSESSSSSSSETTSKPAAKD